MLIVTRKSHLSVGFLMSIEPGSGIYAIPLSSQSKLLHLNARRKEKNLQHEHLASSGFGVRNRNDATENTLL
jgi:hypothetical protein